MNTTQEDQESFEEIGRLIGKLFAGAIKHAAAAAGDEAAALLVQHFRAGRARAVVGLGTGEVVFELRGDDGVWRSFITLKGEVPPELRPN
jgi:hypothetical protein